MARVSVRQPGIRASSGHADRNGEACVLNLARVPSVDTWVYALSADRRLATEELLGPIEQIKNIVHLQVRPAKTATIVLEHYEDRIPDGIVSVHRLDPNGGLAYHVADRWLAEGKGTATIEGVLPDIPYQVRVLSKGKVHIQSNWTFPSSEGNPRLTLNVKTHAEAEPQN